MKLNFMPNGRPGLLNGRKGQGNQAGSVVLEALIAILIFSVGILGLIGMQTTAVSNVSDAKYRADASFFADQIIGQMWASRVTSTDASGVTTYQVDPSYAWPGGTPNLLVQTWAGQSGVAGYLPQGSAVVAISAANPQQVSVMISWLPPKATSAHRHTAVAFIN
jgi:type IV pilus assembly protein PilV